MKNGKMICHFISDQKSPFYQSPTFTTVLGWIQNNAAKCRIKEEKDKLSLTFEKVKSTATAKNILTEISGK